MKIIEGTIFRISKETADWLAQSGLTEQEKSLVVKKIWEITNARKETKQEEIA